MKDRADALAIAQLTWYPSMFNRLTGIALSGTLYLSAIAYLTHPYFPSLDSAHLVQIVHDTPVWLKGSIKLLFAAPFTFHSFNGVRHLLWDVGYGKCHISHTFPVRLA